jgi:type IV secretory pathway TraG/TraD family ATPase VirD4
MVKEAFLTALRKVGFTEIMSSYIRNSDYYTVIKLSNEETAKAFEEEAKKLGFKYKTRLFEKGTDIWVFKAYN